MGLLVKFIAAEDKKETSYEKSSTLNYKYNPKKNILFPSYMQSISFSNKM